MAAVPALVIGALRHRVKCCDNLLIGDLLNDPFRYGLGADGLALLAAFNGSATRSSSTLASAIYHGTISALMILRISAFNDAAPRCYRTQLQALWRVPTSSVAGSSRFTEHDKPPVQYGKSVRAVRTLCVGVTAGASATIDFCSRRFFTFL